MRRRWWRGPLLTLFELATGTELCRGQHRGYYVDHAGLAFAEGGRALLSWATDGSAERREVGGLRGPGWSASWHVDGAAVSLLPDGSGWLCARKGRGWVLSVEGKTGAPFLMPEGDLLPTPDARGFALTRAPTQTHRNRRRQFDGGGPIEVRDLSGAIRVRLARRREGGKRSIKFISERALAFTPDGRRLLTQCGNYRLNPTSIRLWDLASGAVLTPSIRAEHTSAVWRSSPMARRSPMATSSAAWSACACGSESGRWPRAACLSENGVLRVAEAPLHPTRPARRADPPRRRQPHPGVRKVSEKRARIAAAGQVDCIGARQTCRDGGSRYAPGSRRRRGQAALAVDKL